MPNYEQGPERTNRERIVVGLNSDGDHEAAGVEGGKLSVTDAAQSLNLLETGGLSNSLYAIEQELKKVTFLLSQMADINITDEDVE